MPFAGAAPQGTPVYLDTAGAANAEGTIVSSPYLSNDVSDASKKFAAAYKAAFNEDAELHGAKAYDGTQILLTALKNSNVATGKALADAIRATKYDGPARRLRLRRDRRRHLRHLDRHDHDGKLVQPLSCELTGGAVRAGSTDAREAMQVSLQTFIGGLSLGAIYALVAWGSRSSTAPWAWSTSPHGNVVMIGAYVASTFYLSAKLPFALAMVVAIAVTGADRPGHRAGAAAAGEQGLRPDADRHDRLRHRAGGAGDHHLGRHRPGGAVAGAGRAAGRRSASGSAPTTWSCSPSRRPPPCCWCCSCSAPSAAPPCRRSRWTTRRPPRSASTSAAATRSRS